MPRFSHQTSRSSSTDYHRSSRASDNEKKDEASQKPAPLEQDSYRSHDRRRSNHHHHHHEHNRRNHRRRREATLYDAVAGRIGLSGFARNRASSFAQVARPVDVLFRRKIAPVHARARDAYIVDRAGGRAGPDGELLGWGRGLPESDLLKAVHVYFSGFCGGGEMDGRGGGRGDGGGRDGGRAEKSRNGVWRSLDETALLAIGVLLEEACGDVVDGLGYRVFTEVVEEEANKAGKVDGGGILQVRLKRKHEELD